MDAIRLKFLENRHCLINTSVLIVLFLTTLSISQHWFILIEHFLNQFYGNNCVHELH